MGWFRLVLLGVAAFFCLASAGGVAYRPVTAQAPDGVTDTDLYKAAVRVLNNKGYMVRESDPVAMTVSTEWIDASDTGHVMLESVRAHRWRAVITGDQLGLYIDCRITSSGRSSVCSDTKRDEEFVKLAPRLHADILGAASRIAASRDE